MGWPTEMSAPDRGPEQTTGDTNEPLTRTLWQRFFDAKKNADDDEEEAREEALSPATIAYQENLDDMRGALTHWGLPEAFIKRAIQLAYARVFEARTAQKRFEDSLDIDLDELLREARDTIPPAIPKMRGPALPEAMGAAMRRSGVS